MQSPRLINLLALLAALVVISFGAVLLIRDEWGGGGPSDTKVTTTTVMESKTTPTGREQTERTETVTSPRDKSSLERVLRDGGLLGLRVLLVLALAFLVGAFVQHTLAGDYSIKLGLGGVELQRIRERQEQQDQALRRLFHGMVGPRGKAILTALQARVPYPYQYTADSEGELRLTLRNLRSLRLIERPQRSISKIIDDKRPSVDLQQELTITPAGEAYLRLLDDQD